jgi:hypothetical protein
MNTNKLLSAALVVAAFTVIYFPVERIWGQNVGSQYGNRYSTPIQMTVDGDTNGFRQRTSQFGIMDPIGMLPHEQIGINLTVPTSRVNYPVGIAPLDGGEIFGTDNLHVASNGTVSFNFKAGNTAGLYRVQVIIASELYQIQLYVPRGVSPDCVIP